MATVTPNYAADAQLTITLASLASSSTFVAGREATAIDNSANKYDDALLSGKITVGTTPTVNTQILVYVFAPIEDTPTYPPVGTSVFSGTDGAVTLSTVGRGAGVLKLAASILVDSTTSDVTYPFGQVSIAQLFGGIMPKTWSVFVTHNTGVALNATGSNHQISYQGIKFDVV